MQMSMHREPLGCFPPAHGSDVPSQVNRDFLPGIEPNGRMGRSAVRRRRGGVQRRHPEGQRPAVKLLQRRSGFKPEDWGSGHQGTAPQCQPLSLGSIVCRPVAWAALYREKERL